jgi:hypothetical protein
MGTAFWDHAVRGKQRHSDTTSGGTDQQTSIVRPGSVHNRIPTFPWILTLAVKVPPFEEQWLLRIVWQKIAFLETNNVAEK